VIKTMTGRPGCLSLCFSPPGRRPGASHRFGRVCVIYAHSQAGDNHRIDLSRVLPVTVGLLDVANQLGQEAPGRRRTLRAVNIGHRNGDQFKTQIHCGSSCTTLTLIGQHLLFVHFQNARWWVGVLTAPARIIGMRAQGEAEIAIEQGETRYEGVTWTTRSQIAAKQLIPPPEPARRGLINLADDVIAATKAVAATAQSLLRELYPQDRDRPVRWSSKQTFWA
jgi:hypothetical protein